MDAQGELCRLAAALSEARRLSDEATSGYAGAALRTVAGHVYTGKSLTGAAGIGYCAEVAAVLAMLTHGETQIRTVATVSNDRKLMPPCGRCRELMYQVDRRNLDAVILLEPSRQATLRQLFPERWQDLWPEG